jgi:hypothetical protein
MKSLGTGTSFGSAEPQEPYPLPCLNLILITITLITYQFFTVTSTLCLSCLPLASLALRTLADTPLLHGCWHDKIYYNNKH